jgi:aromatic-L-amino-acid/L-tryptophan decarboxylase
LIAGTTNRFVALWEAAPAMAEIEATVIRWLCRLFGYGDSARGILTTGGSLANFCAIVTARHALLDKDFLSGVLYITTETHRSLAKAVRLAGFPQTAVRVVATDGRQRMDCQALREAIRHDRRIGLQPFLVVATAGTANTGTVDPIGELAAIAAEETLWLHVDAAYGGFFQLTERGRHRLAGIERADSITVDPHKGMFLPYGTGALLVRDGQRLRAALHEVHTPHDLHGPYLQDLATEDEIPNFADYSAELSREARGLRLWLPIKLHGLSSFRDALDEKLDLARYIHDHLHAIRDLEVPREPELSVVAFRAADAAWPDPESTTIELLRRINATRRFVLSSARIDGHFMIRLCILSVRTHRDRVEELLQTIQAELRSLHEHDDRRSVVS